MTTLDAAWRLAFEHAWQAHGAGSIGVGAVVVDAADAVVAADRSRSGEASGPAGLLFGSRLAHAEVNALARLGNQPLSGMRLLSTLQPCVLCAGACSFARVPRVEYAAVDAAWDCVDALHAAAPVLTERAPTISWVDLGQWSVWAEALPLAGVLAKYGLANRVGARYQAVNPAMVALAQALSADSGLQAGELDAAFDRWADRLATVPPTRPGQKPGA